MAVKEYKGIIDAHRHLVGTGWTRGSYVKSIGSMYLGLWNRVHKKNLSFDEYLNTVMRTFLDPEGDRMVEEMDKAGVDKTVIFAVDWGLATGEPRVGIREQNKAHADAAKKHPGRFIALAGIDPRRGDAIAQATQCIEEWGMKGLKLMPSAGFYADDPICWPLYEKCEKWGVPIMFHAGGIEVHWEHAQPMYICSAAEKFPGVKMIMAHAACEAWEAAIWGCRSLHNVYMDLSLRQFECAMWPDRYYHWLRRIVDEATPQKVLWASDGPYPNELIRLPEWVKTVKDPKESEKYGVKFTPEEREWMLGKASAQVFDLS